MKVITKYIDSAKCNINFKIGGNALENDNLIDESNKHDLWFHIDSLPSCHVVADLSNLEIEFHKKQLSKIAIQGALICKENSKYKSNKKIAIIYTKIENITKTHIPGKVIASNTKTITI
jgi:predicted ribosome quality control (RQC) complex YloA/Tae2 family protein